MYVMMLGAAQPFAGPGRSWKAIDGEPAFRLITHMTKDGPPDPGPLPSGTEVWIGRLRFAAGDVLDVPLEAGGLLVFAQEPRPGDEDEFDDWIDTEHIPALAEVPGTLLAHRYEAIEGSPKFAAMYYLSEPDVCTSAEWRNASRTPWRERMSKRNINRRRGLYVPEDLAAGD
jgi:hypothetical protein